ncbi:MAG: hypothetical protein ACKOYK_13590 [Cyanobium sp.]
MSSPSEGSHTYGMAPLIRCTLLLLYIALVLPLPLMAPGGLRVPLWIALGMGLLLLLAITSERIGLDAEGLELSYPRWCGWWLRRGWRLHWSEVAGLTPVTTSQGGRVFYVRTTASPSNGGSQVQQAYLLPQRVEHFEEFLSRFQSLSGIPTAAVDRLTPAWTYQLLAAMSAVLLIGEGIALARSGL